MSNLVTASSTDSDNAPAERNVMANPQGKGLVGFLLDWHYSSPRGVVTKPGGQVLAEYFTSLLILSAKFKFKPVFGKDYYLYREGSCWTLSLISPHEWNSAEKRARFVGRCELHGDSTWSMAPAEDLAKKRAIIAALSDFYAGFANTLRSSRPLEDELPFYVARLPYYQRLFAAALSRSIRASLRKGGQMGISSTTWLQQIPGDATRLLAAPVVDECHTTGSADIE